MDYLPKVSLFLLLFVASVSGDIKRIPTPQGTVLNCEKLAINSKICDKIFCPAKINDVCRRPTRIQLSKNVFNKAKLLNHRLKLKSLGKMGTSSF